MPTPRSEQEQLELNRALYCAARDNQLLAVKQLLNNGVMSFVFTTPDGSPKGSLTALHCAVEVANPEMVKLLSENILQLPPEKQKEMFAARDKDNKNAIFKAAENAFNTEDSRYWDCVSAICKAFNTSPGDIQYEGALHYAVISNNLKMARQLLQAGARFADKDINGNTALYNAVNARSNEMVGLLRYYGAEFHLENREKITPIGLASKRQYYDIIAILSSQRTDYEPWHLQRTSKTVENLFRDYDQRKPTFFENLKAFFFGNNLVIEGLVSKNKNTARRAAFHEMQEQKPGMSYKAIAGAVLLKEIQDEEKSTLGTSNAYSKISALAQEGKAKELVIKYIDQLSVDEKKPILDQSLDRKSGLYKFFAVSRGLNDTNVNSGSFEKIKDMQEKLSSP